MIFSLESVLPPDKTHRLRGLQFHNFVDASEHLTIDDDHRSLQGGCSSFDVIEVGIVVDSSLCAYAGGSSAVSTLSQSIVADASELYEVPGLCKKLEISYLVIHCNPATDPIQPLLSQAGTKAVCAEANGLLRTFVGYVESTDINADVVQLFTATTSPEPIRLGALMLVFFATRGGTIQTSMRFLMQSKLLAHEMGHNSNAEHVSDSSDVMYGTLCGSYNNAFDQTSKDAINNKVAQTSYTSVVANGDPIPTPGPTPVPTPVPTPLPTPVPTPLSSFLPLFLP
jgi:hypothetical protein